MIDPLDIKVPDKPLSSKTFPRWADLVVTFLSRLVTWSQREANKTSLDLPDGVTAPDAAPGRGQIYIDIADDKLKIKFSDGTVKVLTTNP